MVCPTALATGLVVAIGSDMVLREETGAMEPYVWPDCDGVRRDGDALVLTDRFGLVKANVGDLVEVGGAGRDRHQFHGCGGVVVDQRASFVGLVCDCTVRPVETVLDSRPARGFTMAAWMTICCQSDGSPGSPG